MTRARDVANLIGSGNYSSTTFTATAGQTAFTIAHTQGFVQVFMNGLLLDETVDWTSDGSAVTLTSGAAAGDEIEVVAYNTFSVGDALNQAAADTRYVNASGDTMSGDLTVSGNEFKAGQHIGNITNFSSSLDFAQFGKSTIIQTGSDAQGFIKSNHYWNGSSTSFVNSSHGSTTIRTNENSAGEMWFETGAAGANPTAKLKIDSSGRVTMPYQPSFRARATQAQTLSSAWQQVGYDTVIDQRGGSNYSTSTGRFTAPVDGFYQFNASWTANNNSDSDGTFFLAINNGTGGNAIGSVSMPNTGGSYDGHVISGCAYLSANDYVSIYRYSTVSTTTRTNVVYGGYFSGYLIG